MKDTLLYVRSHLIATASYLFLGGLVLTSARVLAPGAFIAIVCIGVVLAVTGSADENFRIRLGVEKGELTHFGSVVGFFAYPRPGTSLLAALDRCAGIVPSEIDQIKMQTCSFSNRYLKDLSVYFDKQGVRHDIPIEIMGVGDANDLEPVSAIFSNLTVSKSTHKLRTHFNLVKARDQYYVWYEPEHCDDGSNYIPSEGAFLVEVTDDRLALERFEQDRGSVNAVSPSASAVVAGSAPSGLSRFVTRA